MTHQAASMLTPGDLVAIYVPLHGREIYAVVVDGGLVGILLRFDGGIDRRYTFSELTDDRYRPIFREAILRLKRAQDERRTQ